MAEVLDSYLKTLQYSREILQRNSFENITYKSLADIRKSVSDVLVVSQKMLDRHSADKLCFLISIFESAMHQFNDIYNYKETHEARFTFYNHLMAAQRIIHDLLEQLQDEGELQSHQHIASSEKQQVINEEYFTILPFSPILHWLSKLLLGEIRHNAGEWRHFEEAIAELLDKDGYEVRLGPGRKDGGKDLIAIKEDPVLGFILSFWQAKMLSPGKKVDVSLIRDLAGSCILSGVKVTKGIIVTNTHLTRDALLQIEQDKHLLGKKDREDLLRWIEQTPKRR